MEDHFLYILALTKINGIGPKRAKTLVSYCGGFEEVFKASKKELLNVPHIGLVQAQEILDSEVLNQAETELKLLQKMSDVVMLPYTSDLYPTRLRNIDDGPLFLYYKGNTDALNSTRTVGIVGTRNPSEYGVDCCRNLVGQLASYHTTIISGLAYGVDTHAHSAAVEQGIPTIGILGNGLSKIYPHTNRILAQNMLEHGGLLSEFPLEAEPLREHFPMRNRLIAALSDAVIVVESAKKGGSIITAEFADQYHKDVFAIPGRLGDERSEGTNHLIKINKANLLQSAEDIRYLLNWEAKGQQPIQMTLPFDLSPDEQNVYNIIKELEQASVDQLHYRLEIPLSILSSTLLSLEFQGMIRSLPGKTYSLVRR